VSVELLRELLMGVLGLEVPADRLEKAPYEVFYDAVSQYGFSTVYEVYREAGYEPPRAIASVKVALTGQGRVGKTSLCMRYSEGRYVEGTKSTIGVAIGSKLEVVDDVLARVIIWDHAGQDQYRTVRKMFYRGSLTTLLVYDVSRRDSFEAVEEFKREILESEPRSEIILVGNKIDLPRVVTTEEGRAKAGEIGAIGFYETSAKTGQNVREVFLAALRNTLRRMKAEGKIRYYV